MDIDIKTSDNKFKMRVGAVVVRDIPSNCTAVGVPAKTAKWYLKLIIVTEVG